MKTGIIIPCYNEESRLDQKSFIHFAKYNSDYHLCFVNDGSTDQTIQVLEKIQNQSFFDNVSILNLKKNVGKASAVQAGVHFLNQKDHIDVVGFMDADLSTDFSDFKSLVATLRNNQELTFVYGSRGKGEGNIQRSFFRSIFSKIIKMIVFMILRLPIEDTQCGAKVFKKEILNVAYGKKFLTRWLFDVEIFMRLKSYYGENTIMNKVHEQALERWEHADDSKLGMKDALQIPYMLLSIWLSYTLFDTLNTAS